MIFSIHFFIRVNHVVIIFISIMTITKFGKFDGEVDNNEVRFEGR